MRPGLTGRHQLRRVRRNNPRSSGKVIHTLFWTPSDRKMWLQEVLRRPKPHTPVRTGRVRTTDQVWPTAVSPSDMRSAKVRKVPDVSIPIDRNPLCMELFS